MSPNASLLAGRASGSTLLLLAPDDPGWRSGSPGAATTERLTTYPDPPEAGPSASFTNAATFAREDEIHLVGTSQGVAGASVRFTRGDGGYLSTHFEEARVERFIDVAPSGDGGAWALGVDRSRRAFVVKLTAANTLDTSASGGFIEIDPGPVAAASLAADAHGRVLVFLPRESEPATLVRVLPNGLIDRSYGAAGRVVLPVRGYVSNLVRGLVVERSGAALTGGVVLATGGGSVHEGVVRLDADGRVDPTFGGATAPFLLQPGASTTEDLKPVGVSLLAAPAPAVPGCEPEFFVGFGQRGAAGYLFQ